MHNIHLPKDCTVKAFSALVKRADVEDDYLQAQWTADALGAIALVCTADFLLLKDFLPELVKHCRRVVSTPSDVKAFQMLIVVHPDVMAFVQDLRSGRLAVEMTVDQAIHVLRDMATEYVSVSFRTQAAALSLWLRNPDRSDEDVCQTLESVPWYLLWNTCQLPFVLKAGALELAQSLVVVTCARRALPSLGSTTYGRCIFQIDDARMDCVAAKSLVATVFVAIADPTPA
eukprot:TRINITY_DN65603_c0_g1_i1.p1 TRINITY_DN65603_c0_g1~~TRINITY_DN65603_c0_g1_i1.p1  ORF type:complete len:230 (+),score=15.05 TRINITY_DN65603_c0_g1_i1:269-958(+)